MPLFHYETIDCNGKKASSIIEAPSLEKAKEILRQQKIFVTHLSTNKKKSLFTFFSKEMNGEKLTLFTTKLAELIKAGLPLFQSLTSLAQQAEGEKEQPIIQSLIEQIKEGSSFSKAMNLYPKSFPPLYRAMIASGERVGKLDSSLEKLSTLLTKGEKLKKKIVTSLLYPIILALFSCVVILIMLLFVIPSLESILDQENVNRFTSIVMGISHLLREKWLLLLALATTLFAACNYFLRHPLWRKKIEVLILHIPLIKTIIIRLSVARFIRTLSSLLEGGVSMIEALKIAKEVVVYPLLAEEISRAEKRIIEGSLLSQELSKISWMPPLVGQMAAIGEESGSLFHILGSVATIYEEEVEKSLTRVAELSQPIILLAMGAVVGLIMLAVLIPLTDATHLLKISF